MRCRAHNKKEADLEAKVASAEAAKDYLDEQLQKLQTQLEAQVQAGKTLTQQNAELAKESAKQQVGEGFETELRNGGRMTMSGCKSIHMHAI